MKKTSAPTAGVVLGALLGILSSFLGSTTEGQRLETGPRDRLDRLFADPELARTSRVKLAVLDEAHSLAPDHSLAQINLTQLIEDISKHNPAAVLLFTPDPSTLASSADETLLLARSLARWGRVVLTARPRLTGPADEDRIPPKNAQVDIYGLSHVIRDLDGVTFPDPALVSAANRVGVTHITADRDGFVRRIPIAYRVNGVDLPSLPMAVAMTAFGESSLNITDGGRWMKSFAGIDVPLDGEGNLLLRYRGPRGSFPRASLTTDSSGSEGAETRRFIKDIEKGDIILLESKVKPDATTFDTPVTTGITALEVWATTLDNVIRGDARRYPPGWVQRLSTVLLCTLVGWFAGLTSSNSLALLLSVPLILAYLGFALALSRTGIHLDLISPTVGGIVSIVTVSVFRTIAKRKVPASTI